MAQGEVVGIEVNGNGNRVAGRDYIEVTIRACRRCEQRIVNPGVRICNHCREEIEAQKLRNTLKVLGFCLLLCTGLLMQWRENHGTKMTPEVFVETLGFATCIIGFIYVVWHAIKIWFESKQ